MMRATTMRTARKAIGLDWQNNNFDKPSCFFVHYLAVVAQLQREKWPQGKNIGLTIGVILKKNRANIGKMVK